MTDPDRRLPQDLYTAAGVRELDRLAIEERGIAGLELMERAGQASFELLRELWPGAGIITVICGNGNNGGDGYVIARLASEAGLRVNIIHVGEPDSQKGDALSVAKKARAAGLLSQSYSSALVEEADVVVDALLGTGLDRELDSQWQELLLDVNKRAANILSVDIPSGCMLIPAHV